MSDRGEKSGYNFLSAALFSFVVIGMLVFFWPGLIPFRFFEFWTIKGSLWEAMKNAWPIYAWGIGVNVFFMILENKRGDDPAELLFVGMLISIWAGVAEEICFRWLIFFSAIVLIPVGDWLLLGFMGIHIVKWMYNILCPIANFFTLGYLQEYLINGWGWSVGAALISSNGKFRNGHSYQGLFGLINSWFLGMYFFWVMFTYGIVAAIIIHFLYDFFIFFAHALNAMRGRGRKWA